MVKRTELERHVKFLENEVNALGQISPDSEQAQEMRTELDAVTKDLVKLAKFNSLNYTALLKIIKKHDKVACLVFALRNPREKAESWRVFGGGGGGGGRRD